MAGAEPTTALGESVRLKYEVAPGCPDRAAFEAAFNGSTRRITLTQEEAPRVLEVTAGADGATAWGEMSYHATEEHGAPRRVEAADCSLVISALVLSAVLAMDPTASLAPAPALTSDGEAGTGPEPLAPEGLPAVDAKAPPAIETVEAEDDEAVLRSAPRRGRPARTPEFEGTAQTRTPVRTRAEHTATWAGAIGAWGEARTPEAPSPLFAGLVGGSLVLLRGWRPCLSLALGWGRSQSVDAGPGGADFRLAFGRLEFSPGELEIARIRIRAALGAELGRFDIRVRSNQGALSPQENSTAGWSALLQIVRFETPLVGRLYVSAELGGVEPLQKHYFYVTHPDDTVHRIPVFGGLAGLGATYRFK